MKISIALDGNSRNAVVTKKLDEAKYLFIAEVEKLEVIEIIPLPRANADLFCAEYTVEQGCEAIICGEICEAAFNILADAGVSRYLGAGETPERAIRLMNAYSLPLIREEQQKINNFKGGYIMEFKNVRLIKKANVYHGGKVTSRTFYTESGERKTLGFMLAGEYEFGTDAAEIMEMLDGEMTVLLPDAADWQSYSAGTSFSVPEKSKFKIKVKNYADYCCSYAG